MKKIILLFLLFGSFLMNAQNTMQEQIKARLIDLHEVEDNDENFAGFEQIKKEIGGAKIVMLGEQSHTDATTFETKIKLIKYLHQEMNFEILAFESSIYDGNRAWSMIQKGHDVKDALGKGIYSIWSTKEELDPLYQYFTEALTHENPLMIAGFDTQLIGKLASDHFEEDLTDYLATFADADSYPKEIKQLHSFINASRSGKKIKKKTAMENIAFLEKIITFLKTKPKNEISDFWLQSLKSFKVFNSDSKIGTDDRDQQMAENLIWLQEKYPNKKIICWGATSHFLYNSSTVKLENKKLQKWADDYYQSHDMMGDYLKKKYRNDLYTIGFIAHEGSYGFNRNVKLELPVENSLEYLIGQSAADNYFLSLSDISLEGYLSRPLGHQYMTNDIAKVMDGVVFNRHMRRPYTDWNFLFYLVPENKMWAKKKERFKEYSKQRKLDKLNKEKEQRKKERA